MCQTYHAGDLKSDLQYRLQMRRGVYHEDQTQCRRWATITRHDLTFHELCNSRKTKEEISLAGAEMMKSSGINYGR
jgi:hypothetical protein